MKNNLIKNQSVLFFWIVCLFSSLVINKTTAQNTMSLPYFEGFEDTITYRDWVLNAGPNGAVVKNKWYIGGADAFIEKNSLYISSNEGKTVTYTNSQCYTIVYKEMVLPVATGKYDLSFTWKGDCAEGDGLYVYWLSKNTQTNSSVSGNPRFMDNSKPLSFGGVDFLSASKEWQTVTTEIEPKVGVYKLVFVWKNTEGTSGGASIVIDNIQISTQGCEKPENLVISDLNSDISVKWDASKGATGYELMYRMFGDSVVHSKKGIITNSCFLPGMQEGVYDLFVRSCGPNDTSIWVVKNNILVYNASAHCIDFINWSNEGTECKTGVHTLGGSFDVTGKFSPKIIDVPIKGAVDFGYESISSRHTRHYIPGEKDARTGYQLPTVPEGDVVSVRLGNWNKGGEFESVTYTHQLDSGANMILLLKYAIVIEDPGHPRVEQPVFMLELLDEYGNPLDPSGCGDANFVADTKALIDNPEADGTWHIINSAVPILWKDWTTVGINVGKYAENGPLKFKIRLTTYDCAQGGHFGYAYYTLSCSSANIEGMSCGEQTAASIKAPDGFNYRWYRVRDEKTVCTTQNLTNVEKSDTALYRCKVMFAQDSTCYFELDASLLPKLPKAQFSPRWMPTNCENNVMKFINTSHVITARGATGEKCETHRWYLKEGDDWSLIHEGDSLDYRFANGGGQFDIMLQVGMSNDECVDDTIITINVPQLGAINDTIQATICEGKSHKIEGRKYTQTGLYRVYRGLSFGGCDSTVYLNLNVIPKIQDTIAHYMCKGDIYTFNDQIYTKSGTPRAKFTSACGCDSIVTLDLTVAQSEVVDKVEVCSGDDLVIEYSLGDDFFNSYQILFDADAKAAGFNDTEILPLPAEGEALVVNMPEEYKENINPICPGYYSLIVVFYYTVDGEEYKCEHLVELDVLYAVATLEQKFDNLITIKNKDYNGGFEFESYQWYKNGEPIPGETGTYYFTEENQLSSSDKYTVGLVRKGETEEILCCDLIPSFGVNVSNIMEHNILVVPTIVNCGDNVTVVADFDLAEKLVRWWSMTGVLLSEEVINGNKILQSTPKMQGVYLLEIVVADECILHKIVIK